MLERTELAGSRNKTKTRKKDYKEHYTEETRDIVGEVYRKDVELFGYTFDNSTLPERLAQRKMH